MDSYAFYALGALGVWAAASPFPPEQPHLVCEELTSLLPGRIPTLHSPTYMESPTTVDEVSTAIVTLARAYNDYGEQFAIRSRGHMPHAGAANIQGGVTVDLRALPEVQVSDDRGTVVIGTGASWGEVYKVLSPLNVTVPGGRASSIGVGGFLTGGGLSALGPATEWGCDSVLEYEVVLASGKIITVNETSYEDLFLALKGGSNNFGVATKFTMKTYPSSGIWVGEAYSSFMDPANFDPLAEPVQGYGWTTEQKRLFVTDLLFYTEPRPDAPYVEKKEKEQGSSQPPGLNYLFFTTTFAHSPLMYAAIVSEFEASIPAISSIKGTNRYMAFQPSPALKGQNSLSIDSKYKRLNTLILEAVFPDPLNIRLVRREAQQLIAAIEKLTKDTGVYHPFKDLNYANASQDVVAAYGREVSDKLRDVSKKYDPEGVFQKAIPGGFKLLA
ncbi:hypothetical protein BDW74DRAFT_167490 [Aspergillus multicolor]|uniref:FAD-binding oxidoreductase n=1 Tax=Aspergillus multicolor TaxID=41759 RepID=UPI003CCD6749